MDGDLTVSPESLHCSPSVCLTVTFCLWLYPSLSVHLAICLSIYRSWSAGWLVRTVHFQAHSSFTGEAYRVYQLSAIRIFLDDEQFDVNHISYESTRLTRDIDFLCTITRYSISSSEARVGCQCAYRLSSEFALDCILYTRPSPVRLLTPASCACCCYVFKLRCILYMGINFLTQYGWKLLST